MQDDEDRNHYSGVILEEIRDQNKAILEGLQPIPQMAKDISKLKDDVFELKNDVKAIKAVITNHEGRIIHLETA